MKYGFMYFKIGLKSIRPTVQKMAKDLTKGYK